MIDLRRDGERDGRLAIERLAARLPEPLRGLARLAYNYHWSWQPGGAELFSDVDPQRWKVSEANPVRFLREARPELLRLAAADTSLCQRITLAQAALEAELARPTAAGAFSTEHPVAFFCAEFAVHESLPIYAGGLGALAGDLLKQASDDAVPLVGIGLLYRQGYFRQRTDAFGRQHEYWIECDPESLPATPVTDEQGVPLKVSVSIGADSVSAQIWRVDVGRVPLFLLDSDLPENAQVARWISSRLYISNPDLRLAQYLLLGVGGVRALDAMGIVPGALHINEGHAVFAALEYGRRQLNSEAGLAGLRQRIVFTTHTPVQAGNPTYPAEEVRRVAGAFSEQLGGIERLLSWGRSRAEEAGEPFGLTQLALRSCGYANGVSRRHGEVARAMWRGLWPQLPLEQVPIDAITNGVHHPSWMGAPMRALLERHLPKDWLARAADPAMWEAVQRIPAAELWAARSAQRARLVSHVRERSIDERLGRGEDLDYASAAALTWNATALTIGFARRLTPYKRLSLLIADIPPVRALLAGEHAIQIVIAGKAHPDDEGGKRVLNELFELKAIPEVAAHVVFLDDYDLASAALLIQGCDLWVNLPRPPLEASGTSGMKSAINGGLQLSVLDGWWPEAYNGLNGWALSGEVDRDTDAQDARHGAELQRLLREEIAPTFYGHDEQGLPGGWIERMRASISSIAPAFSSQRMLAEYRERAYRD